jgi:N-methylhydantoinase A/oxoprolinase/acetone carboxylase beta subunit
MTNARSNRFVLRLENNPALLRQLGPVELETWEALSDKPLELDAIVEENRAYARALAKLKRLGLAIYSGFTPTDAVHVLGINSHWSTRAAELSARLWMRQMRFLYGYGKWDGDDIESACREVYELVNTTIRRLLIEVGLNEFDLAGKSGKNDAIVETITRMVLGNHSNRGRKPLFNLDFASDYPIVAVGAPAASYYRDVAESMSIGLQLPEHADVANAFGAVMGSVIQRAQVTVTQPQHGIFCLFHGDQPQNFDSLDAARQAAREVVSRLAQQRALEAGAIEPTVTLEFDDVHVKDKVDGELFLESTVIATAIGRACDWRADLPA